MALTGNDVYHNPSSSIECKQQQHLGHVLEELNDSMKKVDLSIERTRKQQQQQKALRTYYTSCDELLDIIAISHRLRRGAIVMDHTSSLPVILESLADDESNDEL